jgi:HD-like signal output (HDOD) protein
MLTAGDFKQAISAIDTLGATPSILVKVVELIKDPNSDIESIGALLRADGPLSADIIRLSNSPYYAPPTFHGNLNAAIHCIGSREITRVVNLSLARRLFARDLTRYGVSAREYWSDSVAAALLSEALAQDAGLNPEDAFTLGILHAIGRLLINRVIDERGMAMVWDGQQPIEQWERSAVGFDFAEAGAMLLKHWHFPSATCGVIRWQLQPDRVDPPVSLLGCLQFALRLRALTGSDFGNRDWRLPELDPFAQASKLSHEMVSQIVFKCRDDFQRIFRSLGLHG